ncbi:MAG: hypothetical protein HC887_03345 [Desulfobacteraceae bacterium]|nr:hypothetical protein [Desulfobacteraceae bacterium]
MLERIGKGDLHEEAKKIDDELKTAIFDFASATGTNKSDKFGILDSQQLKARNYVKKIEANKTKILAEIQQFLK